LDVNQVKKQKNATPNKPNVIVIYTGDLGYGDIGANGAA
jgi:arylsulfatase A-like enzyme